MPTNIRENKVWERAYKKGFMDGLEEARRTEDKISVEEGRELAREAVAREAVEKRTIDRLFMLIAKFRLSSGATLKEIAAHMNMTMKEARRLEKCRDADDPLALPY